MSIDMVQEAFAEHGETATLARAAEVTTITLKAKRIGGATDDLGNTAVQQAFRVKCGTVELDASAWSVKAPARGDILTLGGRARTVMDAYPVKDGDTVGLYVLEVAG